MAHGSLAFEAIFCKEQLHVINAYGTIGLLTLWSSPESVISRLSEEGVILSDQSPVAVVGTLYGGGFKFLLRNLLHNPQIDTLLLYGIDFGGSAALVKNFFTNGIEQVASSATYAPIDDREVKTVRVIGSNYHMDDLVKPEMFIPVPNIFHVDDSTKMGADRVKNFLATYTPKANPTGYRQSIPVPDLDRVVYPSVAQGHVIIEDSVVTAWRKLVCRIFKFGERVSIRKGQRIELRNMKVVVKIPVVNKDELRDNNIDPDTIIQYQNELYDSEMKNDFSYTYGNRLRGYFKSANGQVIDTFEIAVERLKGDNLDSRGLFLSLWDPCSDIDPGSKKPCMTSIFLRKIERKLELTAVFRTHNALKAWIGNVCALISLLNFFCEKTSAIPGPITIFSQSITLDPGDGMEIAQEIYRQEAKKNIFKEDPNGYLAIRVEEGEIIVDHWSYGILLDTYKSIKPGALQYELSRNNVISDITHAIYVGMQLEKAYWCIQEGIQYVQTDMPGKPEMKQPS